MDLQPIFTSKPTKHMPSFYIWQDIFVYISENAQNKLQCQNTSNLIYNKGRKRNGFRLSQDFSVFYRSHHLQNGMNFRVINLLNVRIFLYRLSSFCVGSIYYGRKFWGKSGIIVCAGLAVTTARRTAESSNVSDQYTEYNGDQDGKDEHWGHLKRNER